MSREVRGCCVMGFHGKLDGSLSLSHNRFEEGESSQTAFQVLSH